MSDRRSPRCEIRGASALPNSNRRAGDRADPHVRHAANCREAISHRHHASSRAAPCEPESEIQNRKYRRFGQKIIPGNQIWTQLRVVCNRVGETNPDDIFSVRVSKTVADIMGRFSVSNLVDRFHETNRFKLPGPHPRATALPLSRGVALFARRLEGWPRVRALEPSFETRRCATLLSSECENELDNGPVARMERSVIRGKHRGVEALSRIALRSIRATAPSE